MSLCEKQSNSALGCKCLTIKQRTTHLLHGTDVQAVLCGDQKHLSARYVHRTYSRGIPFTRDLTDFGIGTVRESVDGVVALQSTLRSSRSSFMFFRMASLVSDVMFHHISGPNLA